MKYPFLYLSLVFLWGCGTPSSDTQTEKTPTVDASQAKGGRYYGGLLQLNEPEFIITLFAPNISDPYSARVSTQVYESLFKYDPYDLKLKNCLAERYTTDNTKTVYTFILRKNVFFHDDPCFANGKGREFVAEDAVYCLKNLVSKEDPKINSPYFNGIIDANDPNALLAVDKYTLKVTLKKPSQEFIYLLAEPFAAIYPKEAVEKYSEQLKYKAVGTGPFRLVVCEEDLSIVLKKNPTYWAKDIHENKLPFLEAIDIKFIKDKNQELEEFKKGNLDMVYRLPSDKVIKIQDEIHHNTTGEYKNYEFQKTPEMLTQVMGFNLQHVALSDKNFRKAIAYAINKENIFDFVLQGEGNSMGNQGLVPPVFPRYDNKKVKGITYNRDSIKIYLAKSNFANKPLPTLRLHLVSEGNRNQLVANEIKKQLKDNMNLEVDVQTVSLNAFQEIISKGKFEMCLFAVQPIHPAPSGLLYNFASQCSPFPNFSNYSNQLYDNLLELGMNADDIEKETELLMAADRILVQDVPFVVLWYDEGLRLVQPHIKNMPNNALQYRNYAEVFIEKTHRLN